METVEKIRIFPFLQGGGEMGELTRNFDWSNTSAGSPDHWPQSLRTTVSNLLRSKFPMFLWWGEDMIQFYNDAYRPSMGNEGKHPTALGQKGKQCWPEIWDIISPLLKQVQTTGEATWMENQLVPIYRNGTIEDVYWTYSYSSVLDDYGQHAGILVTCVETTESVKSHKKIEESQQELLSLFEESPTAIATISSDDDLVFRTANYFYGEIVGRKAEDIIGKPLLKAIPELENQGFDILLKEVITTGKPYMANEVAVDIMKDGQMQTFYVNFSYQPRKGADGIVTGVLIVATDVTQQVISRKKIEESENRYHNLIHSSPFAIGILKGPDLVITTGNDAILQIWGKGKTVFGKPYFEALPELAEQGYRKVFNKVYTTGIAENFVETPVQILQEGKMTQKYYNFLLYPQRDPAGEIEGVGIIASEVTPIAEQNIKIKESEERFRQLADGSPMFVFILDADPKAHVNYWNMTWLEYTGQSLEEAIGNAWNGIIHPDDIPVVMKLYTPAFENRHPYFIPAIRVKRYDGQYRWHSFKGNPRYLAAGEFIGYIGVGFDIHEQKITEEKLEELVEKRTEELQRSNKELQRSNQNLEEFAHAASHDLKEPVRKIHFFTHQLKEQLSKYLDEFESRAFSRIENATERMRNLIDDLLLYSHASQRPQEKEIIDLNQKVQRVLEDLELDIQEKRAEINVGKLPAIAGYRRQLQQVFQNLLSNALKYSKPDITPQIDITASQVRQNDKDYHMISVRDNGIGFEQIYEEKIFQMFSRLHGRSEYSGTGVGLSIVKKVIENHNGFIRVESEPGIGSNFKIYLPFEQV